MSVRFCTPMKLFVLAPTLALALLPGVMYAQTLSLQQATELALSADPRIKEREALADVAQGLIDEAQGHAGWKLDANVFVGVSPALEGGPFKDGAFSCGNGTPCEFRDDAYKLSDGLSPMIGFEAKLIKPLYTFGKIERYSEAAQYNKQVKEGDIQLARGEVWLQVRRAYYGYLTARDTRYLLEDVHAQVNRALEIARRGVEEGQMRVADQYALESGLALVNHYLAKARAVENVARDGLKTLIGRPLNASVEVEQAHITPLPMPGGALAELAERALKQRPEMGQVQAGMAGLRAYADARRAEQRPDIYAGLVTLGTYSPGRETLKNSYIYDPFNFVAATPVVGIRWQWQEGVQNARISQAEAELRAVTEKQNFARQGIPFQVAEAYHYMVGMHESVDQLGQGAAAARRWMLGNFLDFEAGLIEGAKVIDALKAYAGMQADYLSTLNDYNMQVSVLQHAIGEYP
ncbi:MAG: TolC family protein [Pseudomonadota bacterium]